VARTATLGPLGAQHAVAALDTTLTARDAALRQLLAHAPSTLPRWAAC